MMYGIKYHRLPLLFLDLEAPPVVSKADASSDPVVIMLVQSNIRNALQITEFANNNLVEGFKPYRVSGWCKCWGEKKYAMRIWFNPCKLSAYYSLLRKMFRMHCCRKM
jgi:multidrug efflux pump